MSVMQQLSSPISSSSSAFLSHSSFNSRYPFLHSSPSLSFFAVWFSRKWKIKSFYIYNTLIFKWWLLGCKRLDFFFNWMFVGFWCCAEVKMFGFRQKESVFVNVLQCLRRLRLVPFSLPSCQILILN